jgi:hypothetical protein
MTSATNMPSIDSTECLNILFKDKINEANEGVIGEEKRIMLRFAMVSRFILWNSNTITIERVIFNVKF